MTAQRDETPPRRMFDIQSSGLDAQGNRHLRIELTAVRTHTEDVRRVLRAPEGPFELSFEVRYGDHLKSGEVDVDDPVIELCFERGKDPDGVWEVKIFGGAVGAKRQRPLWRQLIFVQKRLRRDDATIAALAERYAPVFVFSHRERYFPVSLETLLRSPEILACEDEMKIKTVFGKQNVPLPELGDFLRYNGHADYLLDFNFLSMRRSIFAAIGGDRNSATIYYSYFEDPNSERFFINYHLIYAFDTKAGLARLTGIGPHVFDRESMVLVFDSGEEPSSMIISGHLEDQTIFLLEKLKIWSQGRIRVRYDDPRTLKLGAHPVIAVAEGSHALYPTSGVYHLSLLREIAGYLDPRVMAQDIGDDGKPIAPDQVLTPSTLKAPRLPTYRLASLGLDRLTSHVDPSATSHDGHNAYLTFSGYWVDVPGTKNARFPPFTRKIGEIADWVDGAYQWEWDDLPERYHENNSIILGFLEENLVDY